MSTTIFPKHLTLSPSSSSSSDRHTLAVNLARRYTIQNENDLMQEDIYDNTMDSTNIPQRVAITTVQVQLDHTSCAEMAQHLMHVKDLPVECGIYRDIIQDVQRRDMDMTHPTQFLS